MGEKSSDTSGGIFESVLYYVVLERETRRPVAFCEQISDAARLVGRRAGTYVQECAVLIKYTRSTSLGLVYASPSG